VQGVLFAKLAYPFLQYDSIALYVSKLPVEARSSVYAEFLSDPTWRQKDQYNRLRVPREQREKLLISAAQHNLDLAEITRLTVERIIALPEVAQTVHLS
jgi:hypothetical protein